MYNFKQNLKETNLVDCLNPSLLLITFKCESDFLFGIKIFLIWANRKSVYWLLNFLMQRWNRSCVLFNAQRSATGTLISIRRKYLLSKHIIIISTYYSLSLLSLVMKEIDRSMVGPYYILLLKELCSQGSIYLTAECIQLWYMSTTVHNISRLGIKNHNTKRQAEEKKALKTGYVSGMQPQCWMLKTFQSGRWNRVGNKLSHSI